MSTPRSKRPTSGSRHGSSFFNKLHRKHDAVHHPEREPLISPPAIVESSPEPEPAPRQPERDWCAPLKTVARKIKKTANDLVQAAGNQARSAVAAVKENPKTSLATLAAFTTAVSIGETAEIIKIHRTPSPLTICNSPECVYATNMIFHNMDPRVLSLVATSQAEMNPCTDFNQYACGGFENQYIPDQHHIVSSTTILSDAIFNEIRYVLESPGGDTELEDPLLYEARKAYSACKNVTAIQDAGLEPLRRAVQVLTKYFEPDRVALRKSLSIPMMSDLSLTPAFLYALETGLSPFMSVASGPHQEYLVINPVSPSSVAQIKDSGKSAVYQTIAGQTMRQVVEQTPPNSSTSLHLWNVGEHSSFENVIEKMIQLEFKLHDLAVQYQRFQAPSPTSVRVPVKDADELLEKLSLKAIVDNVTNTKAKTIVAPSKDYLQSIASIVNSSPGDVIHMYFVWSLVKHYSQHVESEQLLPWKNFIAHIDGSHNEFEGHQEGSRGKLCVAYLNGDMDNTRLGWILSTIWLDSNPTRGHDSATAIAKTIKDIYRKRLVKHRLAKEQLERLEISYVDRSSLPNLGKMYKDLDFGPNHFDNMLSLARWGFSWSNKNQWMPPPSLAEAHYSPWTMQVHIPAALLRSPFYYDQSVPSYLQYASIGSIIGHHMTHPLDSSQAVQHYNTSNIFPSSMWSNKTKQELAHKEQCFSKQYADFNLSGDEVVKQAIADAEGAQISFEAWKESSIGKKINKLPGLERFSAEQLFWLAYANKECTKFSSSSKIDIENHPAFHHLPGPVRIKGTVANNVGFLEAFNCPTKQPVCTWL